jgi:hypothetical protein
VFLLPPSTSLATLAPIGMAIVPRRVLVAAGCAFAAAAATSADAAHTRNILITGYWPPTNEMVRAFSTNAALNPDGWIGQNWESRGFNLYSYFPTFSNPNCTSCGAGMGDLMVDYQDTSNDWWIIANQIQPVAIITFSRTGNGPNDWICETNQYNRPMWVSDYIAPTQPTPAPPDASVPAGTNRPTNLPVQGIFDAIGASGLPITPEIDLKGDGGGFLSEFIAYHGVWYRDNHADIGDPTQCVAAGHIHVGSSISWANAHEAAKVTLRVLTDHVHDLLAVAGDADFDGDVDADDLTAVILHWGPCPAQPSGCLPDLDNNGFVDADDLTAVILNWT